MADADITAAAVAAATASTTAVSGSFSFSAAAADGEMDAATVAVSAAKQSAGYFRGRSFRPLFCTAGVLTVNLPFLFLLLPLAFLIDLVNAVSIYHKSSHKTPLKFFCLLTVILFPRTSFREEFPHENPLLLIYCHIQEVQNMSEKELKLTDLDYATGDHHLQMMKAALPYLDISKQRALSMFIKADELMRTMEFFRENDDGMLSVCDLNMDHPTPEAMLAAVRPYANKQEQDTIDMMTRFLNSRKGRSSAGITPDQLLAILPPDVQAQFETLQMVIQSFAPGGTP